MFFTRYVYSILIVFALLVTACFKKPASEATAKQPDIPIVPVYNGVTDSYLVADGSCNGNSTITFTYSSPLTSSRSVDATCSGDRIFVNLPVDMGITAQVFTISVVGRLQSKKATPVSLSVNYYPLPRPLPGYTISMVGPKTESALSQYQTNAQMATFAIGGEVFSPQSQSSVPDDQLFRTGLSGVIDPSM